LSHRNVVRNLRGRRRRGKEDRAERRAKGKLKIRVDIPSPQEIKAIVARLVLRIIIRVSGVRVPPRHQKISLRYQAFSRIIRHSAGKI